MKVSELIELLSDENPDAEVRLAFQPEYPMEYALASIASDEAVAAHEDDGAGEERETGEIVFLCQGTWLGYGRRAAWGDW